MSNDPGRWDADERGWFGGEAEGWGGRFMPEALVKALDELTAAWHAAMADPEGARRKALAKLQQLTQLDDPESLVVPILIDALLMVESYRGARHQITFLPELTKSVDELLRELDILDKADELARF